MWVFLFFPREQECSSKSSQADESALMTQCDEYKIHCVEKDRLLELVHVLQTR